jgi:OOP family OmpA-OmpF porin
MYDGVNAQIDYDKIEEIVKRYAVTQPAEVDYDRIEDIVKKHKSNVSSLSNNWVLLGVNFDFNKSTLRPESLPILYNAAEILLNNPDIRVEIQGHTDNIGSESYNKKLSLERAQAVRNFLIAKGVAPNRMTAVGMGESNPIMDNSTPEGRQLNRRIEFKVLR